MDQVKKALAVAIQHQFWIITGLSVLMGSVAWFMTSSTLNTQVKTNEELIKSKYSAMSTVSTALPTHPNKDSAVEMKKIIKTLSADVERAWQEQFKRQEQFLQWREDKIKLPNLINKLKRVYPIEMKLTYPDEPKNITDEEKRRFSQYFAEQMPALAEIIGVKWVGVASNDAMGAGSFGMPGGGLGGMPGGGDGSGGTDGGDDGSSGLVGGGDGGMGGYGGGYGGGMGGFGGMSLQPGNTDVVRWSKASQSQLITSLKLWRGDRPTVYQMVYTQENMWILEGIFNIIEKTNRLENGNKATANFQASIKEIEFIKIGRDAAAEAGNISGFASGGSMGGMMGGMGGSGMGGSGFGGGGDEMGEGSFGEGAAGAGMEDGDPSGAGGLAGSGVVSDPADNRYVDHNFKPITGDDLRSKISSQSSEDAFLAVAKRVPVRLKFKIDYKKLPRFLANCGNEGLMLEVRQIRVAAQDSAGGFGGGMGGSMGGEGLSGGAGMMGGGRGGGGMALGGEGGDGGMGGEGSGGEDGGLGMSGPGGLMGGPRGLKSNEKSVEVYGVVYLFNPANLDRLGLNQAEAEEPNADGSAPMNESSTDQGSPASDLPTTPEGDSSAPRDPALNSDPQQPGNRDDNTTPDGGQAGAGGEPSGAGGDGSNPAGN